MKLKSFDSDYLLCLFNRDHENVMGWKWHKQKDEHLGLFPGEKSESQYLEHLLKMKRFNLDLHSCIHIAAEISITKNFILSRLSKKLHYETNQTFVTLFMLDMVVRDKVEQRLSRTQFFLKINLNDIYSRIKILLVVLKHL